MHFFIRAVHFIYFLAFKVYFYNLSNLYIKCYKHLCVSKIKRLYEPIFSTFIILIGQIFAASELLSYSSSDALTI